MTTWFTSDTHFGDHRTLNIWKRPFASVAEMDARLVAEWNARVAPDDVVWHLGDFARTAAVAARVLPQLACPPRCWPAAARSPSPWRAGSTASTWRRPPRRVSLTKDHGRGRNKRTCSAVIVP